jgi:hypothetical protein
MAKLACLLVTLERVAADAIPSHKTRRPPARGVVSFFIEPLAASFPMALTLSAYRDPRPATLTAFSRARNLPTCRYRNQQSTN